MKTTVHEVASILGVESSSLPDQELKGFASLSEAENTDISFLANARYTQAACATRAGLLLAPFSFRGKQTTAKAVIFVENPSIAFATLTNRFLTDRWSPPPGIAPSACVAPSANIGRDVRVGPGVVVYEGATIGDGSIILANSVVGPHAVIGKNCLLHANVTLCERVSLGDRVILHSGVVVGSDGFGFEFKDGRHEKIPQLGTVVIEDDVEIGANSCIDRARFGKTWIKQGTKIDNLVQIAHNVVVGKHCIIVAGTAIAGSTVLGDYVTLGGQVGIAGHLKIGDRVMVGAQSGIGKDIPAGEVWFGSPATPMPVAKRSIAAVKMLDGLFKRVRAIEAHLGLKRE